MKFEDRYRFLNTCKAFNINLPENWEDLILIKNKSLQINNYEIKPEVLFDEDSNQCRAIYIKGKDSISVFYLEY